MEESGAGHGSRPQPQPGTRGAPADRVSSLPDDLLLQVLSHLGYADAAARTTLLSCRWRDLFSHLPEVDVTLCDVPLGSLEDTLHRAARPGVRLLDITVPVQDRQEGGAVVAAVSSVLREATRLSPAQLRFALPANLALSAADRFVAVDLPRFRRATSIDLHAPLRLCLIHLRPGTGLPALERLSISGFHLDLDALIPRCPRLRMLTVAGGAPGGADFTVQSFSLQGLVVDRSSMPTHGIVVRAPALERLTMSFHATRELSVSILAPMLEKVSWRCSYARLAHGIGLWDLLEVSLETTEGTRHWAAAGCSNTDDTGEDACSQIHRINVLSLSMRSKTRAGSFGFQEREIRFAAEISKHMVTDFSALELHLTTREHSFGSFVVCLLGMHHIRNAIRSLKIVLLLKSEVTVECRPNCPCNGPWNWSTEHVSLPNLEKLEIEGFGGEDQEFDFLKLVFGRARMLRRVTVRLPDRITPNGDWCRKLHDIFAAYPSVEADVDLIPGN